MTRFALAVLLALSGCVTEAALNPLIDGVHGYPWATMSYDQWSEVWLPGDTVADLNKDAKGLFRSAWEADTQDTRIRSLSASFSGVVYYDFGAGRTERIRVKNGEIAEVWFLSCERTGFVDPNGGER